MNPPIYTYKRSTYKEGVKALIIATMTMIGLIIFFNVFFGNLQNRDPIFYYLFNIVATVIPLIVIFLVAIPNMKANAEFIISLDHEKIICSCPVEGTGESFDINLQEIIHIERHEDNFGEGPTFDDYYLVTNKTKYKITNNYSTPVELICKKITRLYPHIKIKSKV